MQDEPAVVLQSLLSYLPLLIPGYLAVLWLFFSWKKRAQFPAIARPVTWSALEILLAYFMVYGFWLVVGYLIVISGLGQAFYSPTLINAVRSPDALPKMSQQWGALGGGSAVLIGQQQVAMAQLRLGVLASAVVFPLQILSVPIVLWLGSRTGSAQIGLSSENIVANVGWGVITWLAIAPVVLLINVGMQLFYLEWIPGGPSPHPFTELFSQGVAPVELAMIAVLAMIAAPIIEEMLFRGLVQPWAMQSQQRRWVLLCIALAMVVMDRFTDVSQLSSATPWLTWLDVLSPLLFLAIVAGILLWLESRATSPAWLAIISTSILFAYIHMSHWPSPIALFVLAMGLGRLAFRTQSLVGPIVLHMLFNGIACAQMLLGD